MRSMVGRTLNPLAAALAFSLISALVVVGAIPAKANHTPRTLEVTPETSSVPFGSVSTTLTAVLQGGPADTTSGPINIDWENENDADGASHSTPDATCSVPVGQTECSITATGSGTDYWRVWIDHDNVQSTVEADLNEERISDPGTDCNQAQDEAADCEEDPIFGDATNPGTGCALAPSATEPDCTDVVRVSFTSEAASATFLDCDDATGPDTERETNPDTSDRPNSVDDPEADQPSTEDYSCSVRDQFGNRMSGQTVRAEIENGINDPDPNNEENVPSYTTPDYSCTTGSIPFLGAQPCTIAVTQAENELGTAEICFWVEDNNPLTNEGQTLCASEPTNEAQLADGSDSGNDLADQTELTWEKEENFILDCTPETDTNPAGTAHKVTCTATSPTTGQRVSGTLVRAEATGANDPDTSNSPQVSDFSCTTDSSGSCTFTHGPGGTGSTTAKGTTTYRAWIDDRNPEPTGNDGIDEDVDTGEGRNEATAPGDRQEPDNTDVVEKEWTDAPSKLTMTPESDTANVGECNPFTITVTDAQDQPLAGLTIDVEQVHDLAANNTASDEPDVGFCVPSTGPNPSGVDESKGDRQPAADPNQQNADEEDPDNAGTAGGETAQTTDSQGKVTIGVNITAANNSNGGGNVTVTAFFDPNDNDDPDSGEPKDTSTKTWTPAAPAGGRTIDCEPEAATTPTDEDHTVTCTVRDSAGQPDPGEEVTFTETGAGTLASSPQVTTNTLGQATVTVTSDEAGTQNITGTLTNSTQNEPDTDECQKAANDPQGAPAGQCSDEVTNTWEEVQQPQCSDGEDNDGDGDIDDADDGCSSPEDDDESDDPPPPPAKCPGYENDPRNQIVGTENGESLEGTEGDDIICGLGGNDTIDGKGGNDLILGGDGNDDLRGGDNDDQIYGEGGNDVIRGDSGNDRLFGGDNNDTIKGNSGNDKLGGNGGKDVLIGGSGDDKLAGGAGNDTLRGGGGRDQLRGGSGRDTLRGGRGRDEFYGGSGRDSCDATRKEKAKSC